MNVVALAALILCTGAASTPLATSQDRIAVDADVPGGNIVVEKIDGDVVTVHQDLRDTQGWWFYWRFQVRGAQGRTLTFKFTNGQPVGVRGPAVSVDGGGTWGWQEKRPANPSEFTYAFGPDARDVQFCMAIPYLEKDLRAFLKKHAGHPNLKAATLCKSEKGRDVEQLLAGRLDGKCRFRVLLTCRHHACEMMASFALEGILEEVLAGEQDGKWLRENVEFLALPFMDKDGVEDGDQGKNRKGRDHNRDYKGESVYASVRAVRAFVPSWSDGKLRLTLDMHCPGLRGGDHEVLQFIGHPDPKQWDAVTRFSAILESVQTGPLKFSSKNNLPYGKSWNVDSMRKPGQEMCSRWAGEIPGVVLPFSLELPYANASGGVVTPESARAFGKDLAKAIRRYLEQECKD